MNFGAYSLHSSSFSSWSSFIPLVLRGSEGYRNVSFSVCHNVSSYYIVVVFRDPLQGLYAIMLEMLWIGSCLLPH